MTLLHLKMFIAVADAGSITGAAKILYVAQPTVSQAILELERHYNVKLFDRLSKKLYLTEQGKRLLGYARHVTSLVTEMEQVSKDHDKSGLLKIGASLTIGACLLPDLIKQFRWENPTMQVQAIVKNTQDIESLIAANSIDFAVVEGIIHSPNLITDTFAEDQLVLACGRTHPLYKTGPLSLTELSRYDFIVREQGSGTRELFENTMAAHEVKWQLTWDCNGSDVLKNAAINGLGIAVISQRLIEREISTGELAPLECNELSLKRSFCIVCHKNKYLTTAMKKFMHLCHKTSQI